MSQEVDEALVTKIDEVETDGTGKLIFLCIKKKIYLILIFCFLYSD